MNPDSARSLVRTLGWFIFFGALTLLPMALVGLLSLSTAPAASVFLVFGTVPGMLLALCSGVALILRRLSGFYLAYLAAVISLFMVRIPFVPLPIHWLPFGEANSLVLRTFDWVVVGLLGWAHWVMLDELPKERVRWHRLALLAVAVAGLATFGFWQFQFTRQSGQVLTAQNLPKIGPVLTRFESVGPIEYRSVETGYPAGVSLVFSGVTTETNFTAVAQELKLTEFKPEHRAKFLGLVRSWKLAEPRFATEFGTNDVFYSGRVPEKGRAVFQLCYRRRDGRFTGQLFGTMPPNTVQ